MDFGLMVQQVFPIVKILNLRTPTNQINRLFTTTDKQMYSFLSGNTDSATIHVNRLSCPFSARYVRINPLEWGKHIGLRFDLQGCVEKGVIPETTYGTNISPTVTPGITIPSALPTTLPATPVTDKNCIGSQIDCINKPNGDYQTCGACHFYASCSEGYVYVRPCPTNLLFDLRTRRCEFKSDTCYHHTPPFVGK
ncbi:hypothetical protein KUTeg_006517 [Tegillarca granosa]|uniref:Chitin-binding type-2 domain-containing protein n=1 Tax=Tegillarca granosa TaxID=220873 RepID=A0ABQ9FGQ6_TEGGR|nr:hypothetical protein KUTeg_006517 [Tegillarca granosa]